MNHRFTKSAVKVLISKATMGKSIKSNIVSGICRTLFTRGRGRTIQRITFKLVLVRLTQTGWEDGEGEGKSKQFHFVLDAISAQQAGTFISSGT